MSRFNWVFLTSLYVSQFLPVAFFFMGLPAILRSEGMALEQIGALYLLGIIWVMKFIWAPLVDGIGFGRLGHYRIWLMLMQLGIALSLIAISHLDGIDQFGLMLMLAVVMTGFAATQDVACDAIACRVLPAHLRGIGNAVQTTGGLIGIVVGGGGLLILYDYIGWQPTLWVVAACVLLAMVPIYLFDETTLPAAEKIPRRAAGLHRLWQVWRQPGMGRWAFLLISFNFAASISFALLPAMLVDLGWQVQSVGTFLNITAALVSIIAVFVAGAILMKADIRLVLITLLAAQAVSIALIVLGAQSGGLWISLVVGILGLYCTHNAVATAATSMMMGRVLPGSEGGDFASQHSLYLLVGFVSGGMALQLAGTFGYAPTFMIAIGFVCVAICACGLLLQRHARPKPVQA